MSVEQPTCPRCLGPLSIDGVCAMCETVRAERVAQGLAPTITDPAAVAIIAPLLADVFFPRREPAA